MTAHEIKTEHATWRIDLTTRTNSDWARARPVMVAINDGSFRVQEHLPASDVDRIIEALIDVMRQLARGDA